MSKKTIQKSVYINPKMNKEVLKYMSANDFKSYSEVVNLALEDFFATEASKKSLNLTTQIVNKSIQTEMKKFDNRISDLVVRNLITTYTLEEMLSKLILYNQSIQPTDEKEFLKNLLADSRTTAVQILKNSPKEEVRRILDKLLKE